jgi:hypothetical protein
MSLGLYLAGLMVHGKAFNPLVDLWLGMPASCMAAVPGLASGRSGVILMLGLLVFAAADVAYAFRLENDTYYLGTPLDAGWTAGLCLIAAWADGFTREGAAANGASEGAWTPACWMRTDSRNLTTAWAMTWGTGCWSRSASGFAGAWAPMT